MSKKISRLEKKIEMLMLNEEAEREKLKEQYKEHRKRIVTPAYRTYQALSNDLIDAQLRYRELTGEFYRRNEDV